VAGVGRKNEFIICLSMHTPETRQKFVELRAQGWSFVRLAAELGVAKSTLIEWSRQFRFELQNQSAIELDDLKNRLLGHRQHRAGVLAEKLAAVEAELRKRDLSSVSTHCLYVLSASLQRQIESAIGDLSFVSPVNQIPGDEYVEEIQQWKP
jgi:hypothetical protein